MIYEINVYADNPRAMLSLYSALHRNILDVFNEYGGPDHDPGLRRRPGQPKLVPREQWFTAPARSTDVPCRR